MFKKLAIVCFILGAFCLAGCTSITTPTPPQPAFKNFEHIRYSWGGYKNTTDEYACDSLQQHWWGEGIDYDLDEGVCPPPKN